MCVLCDPTRIGVTMGETSGKVQEKRLNRVGHACDKKRSVDRKKRDGNASAGDEEAGRPKLRWMDG